VRVFFQFVGVVLTPVKAVFTEIDIFSLRFFSIEENKFDLCR